MSAGQLEDRMEKLAQFVSDSFDAETPHSPPHHVTVTSHQTAMTSSVSDSSSAAVPGTVSPMNDVDVEAVDDDGTRSAPQLSHGIRHIILQTKPVVVQSSHRRHHSTVVRTAIFRRQSSNISKSYWNWLSELVLCVYWFLLYFSVHVQGYAQHSFIQHFRPSVCRTLILRLNG